MLHREFHHNVEFRRSLHDPVPDRHPVGSLPLLTHKGRAPLSPVAILLAVVDGLFLGPHSLFDMDLLVLEDHILNGGEPFGFLQLTVTLQVLLPIAPPMTMYWTPSRSKSLSKKASNLLTSYHVKQKFLIIAVLAFPWFSIITEKTYALMI